jgi:tetratricopeptide (TPR) repeat protein
MLGRRELLAIVAATSIALGACGWDPSHPFDRDAPQVKQAVAALDAGDATFATATLEDYLSTGACDEGKIGTPELMKKRPNGAFDLGLSLFGIGESYGRRFGDEELDAGADDKALRSAQIDCALRVVRAIATDDKVDLALRAHARYLEGNLLFLGARYEDAVTAYDESLRLTPGLVDAGDPIARDAAWNRAVALRRIEDKKDAGQDAAPPDSGNDGGKDSGSDAKSDSGPDGGGDSGGDSGGGDGGGDSAPPPKDDGGNDGGTPPPKPEEDAAPPPPPRANQDERMLDQLENAPTVQQESAKKNAQKRRAVRGMTDK